MITITDNAKHKIEEILKEESNNSITKLRVFVQGGGCSGMEYGFTFDDDLNEDDFVIDAGNSKVLVDAMSITYLQGSEIDYVEDINGNMFKIKNPNAQTSCGCGSSFSPWQ